MKKLPRKLKKKAKKQFINNFTIMGIKVKIKPKNLRLGVDGINVVTKVPKVTLSLYVDKNLTYNLTDDLTPIPILGKFELARF